MPRSRMPGVLVAVSAHAQERFAQRVASRSGELSQSLQVAGRVAEAWGAGRVSRTLPAQEAVRQARGTIYVHDLYDRDLVFLCRHDPAGQELVVITLWERERLGPARVPRRFTDALREGRGTKPQS
jgi:hypothetical protein